MLIPPGYTVLSRNLFNYPTEHLYIVISPVVKRKVLLVNITSKKESSDLSCILNKGDHEFIRHESVVNYADATDADIRKVLWAIACNLFKPQKPVSPDLLIEIQKGALISEAFKPKYLKYITIK